GYVSEISEDGRYIYYIVLRSSKAEAGKYDYYNIDSVVKYDTEQNSTINVFKNNSETRYSFTYFNYKNNLVKYRVGDENIGEITRGVGFLNIDRINELVNSNLLKSKDTNESHEVIYMNDKGNKILAVTIENCVTADNPKGADRITGYTMYEIRNLSGN
ncbi:MAG: hypothetical protein Q8930_20455, partial [Bacillota bacterium]|nr:hypothetical protein [Bacillota bacterium]